MPSRPTSPKPKNRYPEGKDQNGGKVQPRKMFSRLDPMGPEKSRQEQGSDHRNPRPSEKNPESAFPLLRMGNEAREAEPRGETQCENPVHPEYRAIPPVLQGREDIIEDHAEPRLAAEGHQEHEEEEAE